MPCRCGGEPFGRACTPKGMEGRQGRPPISLSTPEDGMDTLQRRTLIPVFVGLFLAGCTAHATGRATQRDPAPARAAIEVHNQGRDRIDVYLISNGKGEWLLGRVDPLETA